MNKVKLNVVVEKKVDNRVNNTGRPVNKKSSRQIRLAKQALYSKLNKQFISGVKFKINNDDPSEYICCVDETNGYEVIACAITGRHVCNLDYIGRTKATGYAFVMDKRVNVNINLKEIKFIK
jgi:hypothetical protein